MVGVLYNYDDINTNDTDTMHQETSTKKDSVSIGHNQRLCALG